MLMLVSADQAARKKFRSAILRAVMDGRRLRFVYDECHLIITQQGSRPVLTDVKQLRQFDQAQHDFSLPLFRPPCVQSSPVPCC